MFVHSRRASCQNLPKSTETLRWGTIFGVLRVPDGFLTHAKNPPKMVGFLNPCQAHPKMVGFLTHAKTPPKMVGFLTHDKNPPRWFGFLTHARQPKMGGI